MSLGLNPIRTCRFCKSSDFVRQDGLRNLVHYGTRHYAHWRCLVNAKGEAFAVAEVPQYQQKDSLLRERTQGRWQP